MSPAATPHPTTGTAESASAPESVLPPELQQAVREVTEISSLPEVTSRIVEVVEDPKSTAQDLHDIVKHDPGLAAKTLRVANSASYGPPSQIASLDRAIVTLGLSAVKNIALAASLSGLLRPGAMISERFAARDLWTHCISVGVCARLLGEAGVGQAEEAFVAGLVHDMGLLVEHQVFPSKLRAVTEHCEREPQDFCAVERGIIGADHQAFGAALSAKWSFPPNLRWAISHHHNPDDLQPEFKPLVVAVQLADMICCQNELGFYLTAQQREITAEMLQCIGISEDRIGEVLEPLPRRIQEAKQIFGE